MKHIFKMIYILNILVLTVYSANIFANTSQITTQANLSVLGKQSNDSIGLTNAISIHLNSNLQCQRNFMFLQPDGSCASKLLRTNEATDVRACPPGKLGTTTMRQDIDVYLGLTTIARNNWSIKTNDCYVVATETLSQNCPIGQTGEIDLARNVHVFDNGARTPLAWAQTRNTCGVESTETRTLACPLGETGNIVENRTVRTLTNNGAQEFGSWVYVSDTCYSTTNEILNSPCSPGYSGVIQHSRYVYTYRNGNKIYSAYAPYSNSCVYVDQPPVAYSDYVTTTDNQPLIIDFLANDTDFDGPGSNGQLLPSRVTQPLNGSATWDATLQRIRYVPNYNFVGTDYFQYTLHGGSVAWITVTVTYVDKAPIAIPDYVSTAFNTPIHINFLANDTDADGTGPNGSLWPASMTQGAHGSVVWRDDLVRFIYTPNNGFSGRDTFDYTLIGNSTATVTVDVGQPPPDVAPIANPDYITTAADTPVDVYFLANDTDTDGAGPNGSLWPASMTQGTRGGNVAWHDNPARFTYTPRTGFAGNDTFNYTLIGGSTATVTVAVAARPDYNCTVFQNRGSNGNRMHAMLVSPANRTASYIGWVRSNNVGFSPYNAPRCNTFGHGWSCGSDYCFSSWTYDLP
jgi:hypothetical protein